MLNWREGKNRIFLKTVALLIAQVFFIANIGYTAPSSRSLFKNKRPNYKAIQEQRERTLQQKRDVLSGKKPEKKSPYRQDFPHRIKISSLKDLSSIYIPDSLGRVVEVYQATSEQGEGTRPLVVHIQDLHTNPEAQYNLASILEILLKDYKLDLVCSEGAEGVVDTSSVSSFPDKEVREKTARLFVESGELTGEEYLSITKYPDLPIWGIEDKDIYFENILEFNKIMNFSSDAQVFISQVKGALEELRPKIYSKKLMEIDTRQKGYDTADIEVSEYLDYLITEAPELAYAFKNITLLRETLEFEKTINQDKVTQRSKELLMDLQIVLREKQNKSEMDMLLARVSLFKDQKIAPFSFYSYLDELARRYLRDRLDRYADLFDFVVYLEKVNSLDSAALFNEIEELTYEIKDSLSTNDNQKLLTKSLRYIELLKDFFNLKMSNEQLDYYLNDKESFKVDWFKSAVTKLTNSTPRLRAGQAPNHSLRPEPNQRFGTGLRSGTGQAPNHSLRSGTGQASYIDFNPDLIDLHLSKLEHFYEIARKRDIAMVRNTLSEVEKRNAKVIAFISGGFHTRGITKLLKEKGYSYVVISPYSSTDIDEDNYHFLLSGKRKPLSELINELNDLLRLPSGWEDEEFIEDYNRTVTEKLRDLGIPYGEIGNISNRAEAVSGVIADKTDSRSSDGKFSKKPVRFKSAKVDKRFLYAKTRIYLPPQLSKRLKIVSEHRPISKERKIELVDIKNAENRIILENVEKENVLRLTYVRPDNTEIQSDVTGFKEKTTATLALIPAFSDFYDTVFSIPLYPGPERAKAVAEHLEVSGVPQKQNKRHIDFRGRLLLPSFYNTHKGRIEILKDRKSDARFLILKDPADNENLVGYEWKDKGIFSLKNGSRLSPDAYITMEQDKKMPVYYMDRQSDFRSFDESVDKSVVVKTVKPFSNRLFEISIGGGRFALRVAKAIAVISFEGKRAHSTRDDKSRYPARLVRLADREKINIGYNHPDVQGEFLVEGLTWQDNTSLVLKTKRFDKDKYPRGYFNLSTIVEMIRRGMLPEIKASEWLLETLTFYEGDADSNLRNPIRGYSLDLENKVLLEDIQLDPATFEPWEQKKIKNKIPSHLRNVLSSI